jgi:hypothetical protein
MHKIRKLHRMTPTFPLVEPRLSTINVGSYAVVQGGQWCVGVYFAAIGYGLTILGVPAGVGAPERCLPQHLTSHRQVMSPP